MATIRDLDRKIESLDEELEIVGKFIQASMETAPTRSTMQEITGSKSPEFVLNGLSNTLIRYKAFLMELRDTTSIASEVPIKLVNKLI